MHANISIRRTVAALVCSATLGASAPASALPFAAQALPDASPAAQVQKVWCNWRGCWGWRRGYGWGWGPAAVAGAAVAGAVAGVAAATAAAPVVAAPPPVYDPCWQRWVGPYGGVHWRRVC